MANRRLFGYEIPYISQKSSQSDSSEKISYDDKRSLIPPNREILLQWESPVRPFVTKSPEYYKKLISILVILGLILILGGQFALVALMVSIFVLFYVLSSVPPERAQHEVNNYGVNYFQKQFFWEEFLYYFFTEEGGYTVLNIDTKENYPGRLILLLDKVTKQEVMSVLDNYLPFKEEPPITVFDNALKNITEKLSLE